jgi:lipoate-protein ligase A
MKARLIIDSPAAGAWNMAVDEALLESAMAAGVATLRLYQWSEPTLSLGYFQAAGDRAQHAASRACPLVRRASGGGAIVHDRELTYSLALPLTDLRSRATTDLYDACHETLVQVLAESGIDARMFRPSPRACSATPLEQPFLCFARRTCGDVVCGEHKVVGSAQRRRRGAVLQHGSILLDRCPYAPELPGIAQLADRSLTAAGLGPKWTDCLRDRLNLTWSLSSLSGHETLRVEEIMKSRFANEDYTLRR